MAAMFRMCAFCRRMAHVSEAILTRQGDKQVRVCLRCVEAHHAAATEKRAILAAKKAA